MHRALTIGGLTAVLVLSGCVPKKEYDKLLRDSQEAKAAMAAEAAALQADIDRLKAELAEAAKKQAELETATNAAEQKLEESILVNDRLSGELEALGRNVDQLLADKGVLARSIADARKRLADLRKAQAVAERRAKVFRDLQRKLKKMVDAGDLRIVFRNGRMVLQLPSSVLFDSGKATLKKAGEQSLTRVAAALKNLQGRNFQVAGHTDNEPIRRSKFQSNWQLSTERALAVVVFLTKNGMRSKELSAAGYGEFDPIANNQDKDGRARNRRIEITLQPNIDELIAATGAAK